MPLPTPHIIETQPTMKLTPVHRSLYVPKESVGMEMLFPTGSAVFRNGDVVAGASVKTGKVWKLRVSADQISVTPFGPNIIVFEGSRNGWSVCGRNGATGKQLWRTTKSYEYLTKSQSLSLYAKPVIVGDYMAFATGRIWYDLQFIWVNCRNGSVQMGPTSEMLKRLPELQNKLFALGNILVWNGALVAQSQLPRGMAHDPLIVSKSGVIVPYSSHAFLEEPDNRGFAVMKIEDIVAARIRDAADGAGNGPTYVSRFDQRELAPPYFLVGDRIFFNYYVRSEPEDGPESSTGSLAFLNLRNKKRELLAGRWARAFWPTDRGLYIHDFKSAWLKVETSKLIRVHAPQDAVEMSPYGFVVLKPVPKRPYLTQVKFVGL